MNTYQSNNLPVPSARVFDPEKERFIDQQTELLTAQLRKFHQGKEFDRRQKDTMALENFICRRTYVRRASDRGDV